MPQLLAGPGKWAQKMKTIKTESYGNEEKQ